jgi:hypothetical protein
VRRAALSLLEAFGAQLGVGVAARLAMPASVNAVAQRRSIERLIGSIRA